MSKRFSRILEVSLQAYLSGADTRPGELRGAAVYTSREDAERAYPCVDINVEAQLAEGFEARDGEYEGTLTLTSCVKADDHTPGHADSHLASIDSLLRDVDTLSAQLYLKAGAQGWILSLHDIWQDGETGEAETETRLIETSVSYGFMCHGSEGEV